MKIKAILFMLLALMIFSTNTIAFAKEEVIISEEQAAWLKENITETDQHNGNVYGEESWIRNYLTADSDKAAMEENEPIIVGTWSKGDYSGEYYLKKGKTLEDLSHKIDQSKNNGKVMDRVFQITDGLSTPADTEGAIAALSGFTPLISLLIGVLVTLITVGMTIFSALDIAYIAFPVIRNKGEEAKANGGYGTKVTANGDVKLTWVTDDAQYAVKEGTIGSGKSPWAIYFKRRVMSYIMLAIILFILMTGNIHLITGIALNLVSGIINVLSGLA